MIRAHLATTPGYQSIMSLVYPYDMWSRSVALNDLSDVAVSLLIFLRQSTLSAMLLAQGWVNFSGCAKMSDICLIIV